MKGEFKTEKPVKMYFSHKSTIKEVNKKLRKIYELKLSDMIDPNHIRL